ncbi:MAG: GSCFA family protein, partial [Alphaproteobacteria bacterium]
FMRLVKSHRDKPARYLVTVSPVPLTATASGQHVQVATTHSKSVLRAVCGELAQNLRAVDYFPSYEIITAPATRGIFYAPNLRSVTPAGVETVMRTFFAAHDPGGKAPGRAPDADARPATGGENDVVCEEALLEAFAK